VAVLDDVLGSQELLAALTGRLRLLTRAAVGVESYFIPFAKQTSSDDNSNGSSRVTDSNVNDNNSKRQESVNSNNNNGSESTASEDITHDDDDVGTALVEPRSVVELIILKYIAPHVLDSLVSQRYVCM
jgi:hypothetical protein